MVRGKLGTSITLFLVVALFLGAVGAQHQLDQARARPKQDDLRFLPNEKLLAHFTAGLGSVVADLLWLQCVNYVAVEQHGARSFKWLSLMLETITRLDPYFHDVYLYGGIFLAALRADDAAALTLFERGMVAAPDSWELPYQAAMVYLLNRGNESDSRRNAGFYVSMSAATGAAPEYITTLAERLQMDYDLGEMEEEMWHGMLANDDTLLRELAERKLLEAELKKAAKGLTAQARRFRQDIGRPPASVEELCAALRIAPPQDPLGGRFFIDVNGDVQNTTVLDTIVQRYRTLIEAAITNYREKNGAPPPSLEAMINPLVITEIPKHPYPGQEWHYDPATGTLQ